MNLVVEVLRRTAGGQAGVGVLTLGIMPWNFPYYQIARFVGPNLVLGNTIVLNDAELCPRYALSVQKIMDDAGVPDYRGPQGSLSRHTPMTYQEFRYDSAASHRYWTKC